MLYQDLVGRSFRRHRQASTALFTRRKKIDDAAKECETMAEMYFELMQLRETVEKLRETLSNAPEFEKEPKHG